MRKPRDIDSELKALADKAKGLKAKRVLQLGELVTVTGADTLDLETLAGVDRAFEREAVDPSEFLNANPVCLGDLAERIVLPDDVDLG